MTCGHCEASVRAALEALPGVSAASADRTTESATYESDGTSAVADAVAAINAIGFEASAG